MKILFVEDELSKNISRVVRLFEKFLGKDRIARLEALDADPYGASSEEIKAIIDETGIVEADYRFPQALKKVTRQHAQYALFIIDRNLVEGDYRYEEALEADPAFSEKMYNDYFEREGDYLLYKLALLITGLAISQKFFFLTAYDAASELKNAAGLQELIGHLGDFKKNNLIEKGNEKHFFRLKEMVDNHQDIRRVAEHQHHVNLLRKYLDEKSADRFVKLILDRDKRRRVGDNLNEIRQIYQKILSKCCALIPEMNAACVDNYGHVNLGKKTLDWLSENGHINSIIRNHCFSIKTICSDFGGHDHTAERQIFAPGTDTVNALFFALKDVIGWFGKLAFKR